MGSYLRKTYGPEMVVFGFAFNQGGFQSVEPGHGLHDFNVMPAPTYTLDSILAASKIPIFALDWRQVPEKGAGGGVAELATKDAQYRIDVPR
jgi:hypothetical protein